MLPKPQTNSLGLPKSGFSRAAANLWEKSPVAPSSPALADHPERWGFACISIVGPGSPSPRREQPVVKLEK